MQLSELIEKELHIIEENDISTTWFIELPCSDYKIQLCKVYELNGDIDLEGSYYKLIAANADDYIKKTYGIDFLCEGNYDSLEEAKKSLLDHYKTNYYDKYYYEYTREL